MKKRLSYEKMARLLSKKFKRTVFKDVWYGGAVCLNCGYWTKEMIKFLEEGYETTSGNDFLLIGFFEH